MTHLRIIQSLVDISDVICNVLDLCFVDRIVGRDPGGKLSIIKRISLHSIIAVLEDIWAGVLGFHLADTASFPSAG